MKRKALAAICIIIGAALAVIFESSAEITPMETAEDVFAVCCEVAGYMPPSGYALEGFRREDINADGVTDAAIVLAHDNGSRLLVLLLSSSSGYTITESNWALPSAYGAQEDTLTGIELSEGMITLHTGGGAATRYANEYVFAEARGQVMLRALSSIIWDTATGSATRSVFDFAGGSHWSVSGSMAQGDFMPGGPEETHLFTLDDERLGLKGFVIDSFPVTWEAFSAVYSDAVAVGAFASPAQSADEAPEETEPPIAEDTPPPEAPAGIICDVCGQTFMDENEFRGHLCVSYPTEGLVYCDVCGNWFAEGEAFRDHSCVPLAK